jgi:hypothetical protein
MDDEFPFEPPALGEEIDEQDRLVRLERLQQSTDLMWLMSHKQGRRIASRLLEQAGVFRSSFNEAPSVMAFNEGRRDMGIWITAELLAAASDEYFTMLREFHER